MYKEEIDKFIQPDEESILDIITGDFNTPKIIDIVGGDILDIAIKMINKNEFDNEKIFVFAVHKENWQLHDFMYNVAKEVSIDVYNKLFSKTLYRFDKKQQDMLVPLFIMMLSDKMLPGYKKAKYNMLSNYIAWDEYIKRKFIKNKYLERLSYIIITDINSREYV